MNTLTRPCAALLLMTTVGLACADGSRNANVVTRHLAHAPRLEMGSPVRSAMAAAAHPDSSTATGHVPMHLSGVDGGGWDWRGLKGGLHRALGGGWRFGLNYGRASSATGAAAHDDGSAPRQDGRPTFPNGGHRGLVISMGRSF